MISQLVPYQWICCQLGAREHYAIPRALQGSSQLIALITDAWVSPKSLIRNLPNSRLQERFHPDLAQSSVYYSTFQLIHFELIQRFRKSSNWELVIARNIWFQAQVVKQLEQIASSLSHLENPPVIFAYSYAALEILRYAKERNWVTVLGQIDPGPVEEQIVARLHQEAGISSAQWQPAPASYWHNWRQECDLADHILVNSDWSKQALKQVGIEAQKVQEVPLAYQPPAESIHFQRSYPKSFTPERPLRVLFLGQVNLRKGILPLLKAIDALTGTPIELWVVGPVQVEISPSWLRHPQIHWIGSVARSEVVNYYRESDVFVLPTYSDGFALTQLEALAWQLPLVVSAYCGAVVIDKTNGFILNEVRAESLVKVFEICIKEPLILLNMSKAAASDDFFLKKSLEKISQQINQILD